MKATNFGKLLRDKRMEIDMTLREFARLTAYDASNISKVERNIIAPPPTLTLRAWAKHLQIDEGSNEMQELLDAAELGRNRIPDDAPAEFRNQLLPALLRTVRSNQLTKEEFDRLVKLLNK